jgi:2-keto-myo-inositol isomerase
MKLALNGATTMKADLATDLRAAEAAGFDLVEIWAAKLRNFLKASSPADLRRLFEESGLKPLSINSIEHVTFRTPADYAGIRTECEELSSLAAALRCPYIVVVPGRLPEQAPSLEEIIDESVRVLTDLIAIAERHGVGLAFEFLGQTDCSVQTLELADEIVTRVGRSDVGLVIDSFHFYAGRSTIDMIEAVNPESLFIFHINDAENLPREQLQDSHRLLPGLGILPLTEMLRSFKRIGYDRVASIEIFRPEYWERDPFELARDAKAATERVLATV